jgi:hypothetical protein
MDLEQWWPNLSSSDQRWLIEHNGEALPGDIETAIRHAGGSFDPHAWWCASGSGQSGFSLSDAAVDWIEAVANGEAPAPRD